MPADRMGLLARLQAWRLRSRIAQAEQSLKWARIEKADVELDITLCQNYIADLREQLADIEGDADRRPAGA